MNTTTNNIDRQFKQHCDWLIKELQKSKRSLCFTSDLLNYFEINNDSKTTGRDLEDYMRSCKNGDY